MQIICLQHTQHIAVEKEWNKHSKNCPLGKMENEKQTAVTDP